MTIRLFKTKADAQKKCVQLRKVVYRWRNIPVKIRFDKRDDSRFGMRGFGFTAKHGKNYYIIAESKKEARSWGLYSKIY